jgi:hypothetical protein
MIEEMKKVDIRPNNSRGWINISNNNIGGQHTQVFQPINTSYKIPEADKTQLDLQRDRDYTDNLEANLKTFISNLHDYEESEDEVEDTEDEYEDDSKSETGPEDEFEDGYQGDSEFETDPEDEDGELLYSGDPKRINWGKRYDDMHLILDPDATCNLIGRNHFPLLKQRLSTARPEV